VCVCMCVCVCVFVCAGECVFVYVCVCVNILRNEGYTELANGFCNLCSSCASEIPGSSDRYNT